VTLNVSVMPGLVPGIHAFFDYGGSGIEDVDGRTKSGHDGLGFIRRQAL
jgi:hypothetical protein